MKKNTLVLVAAIILVIFTVIYLIGAVLIIADSYYFDSYIVTVIVSTIISIVATILSFMAYQKRDVMLLLVTTILISLLEVIQFLFLDVFGIVVTGAIMILLWIAYVKEKQLKNTGNGNNQNNYYTANTYNNYNQQPVNFNNYDNFNNINQNNVNNANIDNRYQQLNNFVPPVTQVPLQNDINKKNNFAFAAYIMIVIMSTLGAIVIVFGFISLIVFGGLGGELYRDSEKAGAIFGLIITVFIYYLLVINSSKGYKKNDVKSIRFAAILSSIITGFELIVVLGLRGYGSGMFALLYIGVITTFLWIAYSQINEQKKNSFNNNVNQNVSNMPPIINEEPQVNNNVQPIVNDEQSIINEEYLTNSNEQSINLDSPLNGLEEVKSSDDITKS